LFSRWPIRNKLLLGLGLLLAIVVTLSYSGIDGLYAYRSLLKDLRRVNELPLATELGHRVSDLRIAALDHARDCQIFGDAAASGPDARLAHEAFRHKLAAVRETLIQYCDQLRQADDELPLGDRHREHQTADQIRAVLDELDGMAVDECFVAGGDRSAVLDDRLRALGALVGELPGYLQDSIQSFPFEVRSEYRRRIVLAWVTSGGTVLLLGMLVWLTYKWIFRPLRVLIKGARKVAADRFDYRIQLRSRDEMGELAAAMNQMNQLFQTIRDDLDRQVQERTRQVVRSEQLASVGFLAAGVAHEINAPLRRIAACAQAIQQRLDHRSRDSEPQRRGTLAQLRQIQEEAFRCKEITQSLLDFSRMGSAERQAVDLSELVRGMIDMLRHVGRYQGKRVEFKSHEPVIASVNTQQMRVVVLNLLCHGLDSIDASGSVNVELRAGEDGPELAVADDGRGMTPAELAELFEPCALRRGRQGTGLGLAISARIIKDHGGCITASSAGLGQGTQFRVRLPRAISSQEPQHACETLQRS